MAIPISTGGARSQILFRTEHIDARMMAPLWSLIWLRRRESG